MIYYTFLQFELLNPHEFRDEKVIWFVLKLVLGLRKFVKEGKTKSRVIILTLFEFNLVQAEYNCISCLDISGISYLSYSLRNFHFHSHGFSCTFPFDKVK